MRTFSLEEAINFVGVSEKTFNRFLSAGYFSPHLSDGKEVFSADEIAKVFGVKLPEEKIPVLEKLQVSNEEISENVTEEITSEIKEELVFPEIQISANLSNEVEKLKQINNLQEQLLDMKDKEIADLKEQRAWLQERYTKMEEKSERDQLLLISETQMLTKIIANQSKKSTWQRALTWLGLEEEEKQTTVFHKN